MKRMKWLSLLLAAIMALMCLAGCGSATKQEANAPQSSSDGTGSDKTTADDPTVITVGTTTVLQNTPIPWYETEIWKKVEEIANVKVEYAEYDEEQFNLMLSSGDLPDLFFSTVGEKIDDIIASKLALNLDPLLEEYAPNMLLDDYSQALEFVRTYKGGENHELYFIPGGLGDEFARGGIYLPRGYFVRWDYYMEIGAPEITDDDAYIDALEKMVAAHPVNENGEKNYGMGLYDDINQWYIRAPFVEPVLLNPWTFSGSQYMAEFKGGELINGYTNTERSAFWVDMEFYNKLYNKGLLDPDSFTQTSEEYDIKNQAGRYMGVNQNSTELYNQAKATDPNTIIGHIAVPSPNALFFSDNVLLTGDFPTHYMFVSAKSENKEAVLRLLNTVHDMDVQRMMQVGFEGVHWSVVDGVPTLTDEVLQMLNNGDEKLAEIGITTSYTPFRIMQPTYLHPDGAPLDLREAESLKGAALNPLRKSMADFYGVDYPSATMKPYLESGEVINLDENMGELVASVMAVIPTDVARIMEKCNDILYRAIPKLVMAASEAEFETVQAQVMKDLADAGEADAWAWCETEYNTAKAQVEPIFYDTVK